MDNEATHDGESSTMIGRREFLHASAAATAAASLPCAARARPVPTNFDIVEEGMVFSVQDLPATLRIAAGTFLSPAQARRPAGDRLTALLSPANAALLAEYMRFEHGVRLDDQPFPARGVPADLTIRPDARLVTVDWSI